MLYPSRKRRQYWVAVLISHNRPGIGLKGAGGNWWGATDSTLAPAHFAE